VKENHPRNLQEAARDLYEACKQFVAKVESSRARSLNSYMQMKAAIAKADGPDCQDGCAWEIEPPPLSSHATL